MRLPNGAIEGVHVGTVGYLAALLITWAVASVALNHLLTKIVPATDAEFYAWQQSTAPRTPQGKARVACNAYKGAFRQQL
jgi:hypothetical protein